MPPNVVPLSSGRAPNSDGYEDPGSHGVQNGLGAELSEDSIARVFTDRHRNNLRFDHSAGCWYQWIGTRWVPDRTQLAFNFARQYARELSRGQRSLCKASVASGVEKLARADRAHAVVHDVWDNDPWLLGTPGGTVDLRTGTLREASPNDYISKETAAAPQCGTPKIWLKFLHDAVRNDQSMVRFLQQWVGYCLTGITTEHSLVFLHGPGGNGKSVFLNTVQRVLAGYAVTAAMETFTASQHDRHPAEVAHLCGARLVAASETEQHRKFAESRIKELTGGDRITARFMRQNPFTFEPTFKLMFAGNHAPILGNVDPAMRRRIILVPFTNEPSKPDKDLPNKLEQELGQILTWAIDGCLDWQVNNLVKSVSIIEATESYFYQQDTLGQWIDSECTTYPNRQDIFHPVSDLICSYNIFLRNIGREPITPKMFGSRMKRLGYISEVQRVKGKTSKVYPGIILGRSTSG